MPPDHPVCVTCDSKAAEAQRVTNDLVSLVVRLSLVLRKASPKSGLPQQAMDLLRRENLFGNPLRWDPEPGDISENKAKER